MAAFRSAISRAIILHYQLQLNVLESAWCCLILLSTAARLQYPGRKQAVIEEHHEQEAQACITLRSGSQKLKMKSALASMTARLVIA